MKFTTIAATILSSVPCLVPWTAVSAAEDGVSVVFEKLSTTLPKGISDHSATLASNGLIYVAGGCDSADGNEYIEDGGFFACNSISNSFYSFDPSSEAFMTLENMPRQRYRHAAVAADGRIWFVGGRDVTDQIISEVDVYKISDNTWMTFTDLQEKYQVSDHAGFGYNDDVYITGGYDLNYTAQDLTYRIDAAASTTSLVVEDVASMVTARGDIHSVITTDDSAAYVGGGFTDDNGFCTPLSTVERFDFHNNEWSTVGNLINPRGEIVMVELEGLLYSLGGERQIENICNIVGASPDPGELTIAEDDIEILENSVWRIIAKFPNYKFRFAAVGIKKDGEEIVYTFGGQNGYDEDCSCFPTSNEVSTVANDSSSSFMLTAMTITTTAVSFMSIMVSLLSIV